MSWTSDDDEVPLSAMLNGSTSMKRENTQQDNQVEEGIAADSCGSNSDGSVSYELEEESESDDSSSADGSAPSDAHLPRNTQSDSLNRKRVSRPARESHRDGVEKCSDSTQSSDGDLPLNQPANASSRDDKQSALKAKTGDSVGDNDFDSEDAEDDIPLSSRQFRNGAISSYSNGLTSHAATMEDSDDDLPLASRLTAANSSHSKSSTVKKTSGGLSTSRGKTSKARTTKTEKIVKREQTVVRRRRRVNDGDKKSTKAKKEDEAISRKFELPGQRRDAPPGNDPLRLFYESMYHERMRLGKPSSLAETWMLHHGLLDAKTAVKVHASRRK